ncbi:MAG: glycosyltransferase family 4 protein [Fuerstiella sp.]
MEKYAGQLGKISARRTATAVSKEMRRIVEATKPDAVIGAVMPWMLLDIPENTRLVYFTDVVTSMANTGYPAFANRSEHYKQESILLERELFERVDAAAFPASVVREAAIANGLPASKSHVVFMGPNMQPRALITEKPPPQNHLVVLIVASDPVRKQTDLALQACRGILDAGWAVDVDLIGPATPLAQSLPFVRCHGRLQLGTAKDSAIHRGALERAHLLLLPSLAEGAPIAPCEAAHFAVPSVVSAAGGLPDVVLNNQTGRVLPITAMAEEYTTAMLALISDKALYSRTSRAALQRSQAKFTWEAWAATLLSLATPHQRRLDALPECTRS